MNRRLFTVVILKGKIIDNCFYQPIFSKMSSSYVYCLKGIINRFIYYTNDTTIEGTGANWTWASVRKKEVKGTHPLGTWRSWWMVLHAAGAPPSLAGSLHMHGHASIPLNHFWLTDYSRISATACVMETRTFQRRRLHLHSCRYQGNKKGPLPGRR